MKFLQFIALAFFLGCGNNALAQSISFYVVAHPDDWQLFMNPNAFGDLRGSLDTDKVVFIYITSGDDNMQMQLDARYPNATIPFAIARERAAVASSRFVSNMTPKLVTQAIGPQTIQVANHNVTTYTYRNTVHYFLRLPDHVRNTNNFSDTDLDRIVTNNQPLTTIDNGTTYVSHTDLSDMVAQIMIREWNTGYYPYRYLNRPDTDSNKYDHSDHKNAGKIAQEAADYMGLEVYAFEGYTARVNNLIEEDYSYQSLQSTDISGFKDEVAQYAIVSNSLMESGFNSNWDSFHKSFLGRNYYTRVTWRSRPLNTTSSDDKTQVEVYPTPTDQQLNVQLPNDIKSEIAIDIYDSKMKVVKQSKISKLTAKDNIYTIDISTIPYGIYFIDIKYDGKSIRRKIVKAPH